MLGFTDSSLAAQVKAELRYSPNSDREHDQRARKGGGQHRHGEGHLSIDPKELDAYVASVLGDEVDEGYA